MKIKNIFFILFSIISFYNYGIIIDLQKENNEDQEESLSLDELKNISKKSVTLSDMYEDHKNQWEYFSPEELKNLHIPLQNVKRKTFLFIKENSPMLSDLTEENKKIPFVDVKESPELVEQLEKKSDEELVDILLTANYLDIPVLLKTAVVVAAKRWIGTYSSLLKKDSYDKWVELIKLLPRDLVNAVLALTKQTIINKYVAQVSVSVALEEVSHVADKIQFTGFEDDNTVLYVENDSYGLKTKLFKLNLQSHEKSQENLLTGAEEFEGAYASPNGAYYALVEGPSLALVEKSKHEVVKELADNSTHSAITGVAWKADSTAFVYVSEANGFIFDLATQKKIPLSLQTVQKQYKNGEFKGVVWNSNKHTIFIVLDHGLGTELIVIDDESHAVTKVVSLSSSSNDLFKKIVMSPTGDFIAIVIGKTVSIYNTKSLEKIFSDSYELSVETVAFHPNNIYIAVVVSPSLVQFEQKKRAHIILMDFINKQKVRTAQNKNLSELEGYVTGAWNKAGTRFAFSDEAALCIFSFAIDATIVEAIQNITNIEQIQLLNYMLDNKLKDSSLFAYLQSTFNTLPENIKKFFQ